MDGIALSCPVLRKDVAFSRASPPVVTRGVQATEAVHAKGAGADLQIGPAADSRTHGVAGGIGKGIVSPIGEVMRTASSIAPSKRDVDALLLLVVANQSTTYRCQCW